MNIAILGAGAMGMLFGGFLSQQNHVVLIDINRQRIDRIRDKGVTVRDDGTDRHFFPEAKCDSSGLGAMDLILVFVKSMFTCEALRENRALIGPDTYLMTLQNGAGHEGKLLQFADRRHVIIGSTQHNSSILDNGHVNHGGGGMTSIGLLDGGSKCLQTIADKFTACGFDCITSDAVKEQIWNKLFLNTSASALTAILQVPLGFILDDPYANVLMHKLADEAVAVANAQGIAAFEADTVIASIETVLANGREGYTSIYADIKCGNRTEVDTISGSVVTAAKELGIAVPYHEMTVALLHAMENRATHA